MSFRFWLTESLCRNIFLGERVGDDSLRIRTRTLLLGERIPSSARLFRAFEVLVLGAAGFVYRGIAVMLTISGDCGNTENYRIPSECCHRARVAACCFKMQPMQLLPIALLASAGRSSRLRCFCLSHSRFNYSHYIVAVGASHTYAEVLILPVFRLLRRNFFSALQLCIIPTISRQKKKKKKYCNLHV